MPATPLTSLILPTFNPGPRLSQTLHELRGFVAQAPGSWEVLFVCDGCTDGAAEQLHQLARAEGWFRVLDHRPNRGKGYAVRRGLAAARGAWRIFTDVDLAYAPSEVLKVAQRLWQGDAVVIASRRHPDSRVVVPAGLHGYAWLRQVQGRVFGAMVRSILSLPYEDTQAGLKGFSADTVRQIVPHLQCNGFGFDCEVLAVCDRIRLAVTEVPVSVRFEGMASTTGWRTALATLGELWQVRHAVGGQAGRLRDRQAGGPSTPHPRPAVRQGVPS